jgi:23S rRNA A1618 N6-methylase RlmF
MEPRQLEIPARQFCPVIPRREHLVRPGRRPDIPQDRLCPRITGSTGTACPGPSSQCG